MKRVATVWAVIEVGMGHPYTLKTFNRRQAAREWADEQYPVDDPKWDLNGEKGLIRKAGMYTLKIDPVEIFE